MDSIGSTGYKVQKPNLEISRFWDLSKWDSKQKRFLKQTDTKLLNDLKIELDQGRYKNYDLAEINNEFSNKVKTVLENYNHHFLVGYLSLTKDQIDEIKASLLANLRSEWQTRRLNINHAQSNQETIEQGIENTQHVEIPSANLYKPLDQEGVASQHVISNGNGNSQVIEDEFSGPLTYNVQSSSHGGQVTQSQTYNQHETVESQYGGFQLPENDGQQVEQEESLSSNVGMQQVSISLNNLFEH